MERLLSLFFIGSLFAGVALARPAPPVFDELPFAEQTRQYAKIVYFNKNKDAPLKDYKLILKDVANLLKDHPEITLLEIAGHADPGSEKKKAQKISEARAEWAKRYIISQGVMPPGSR